jgi:hypothetical protein
MSHPRLISQRGRLDHLFAIGDSMADIELQAHWSRYLCILVSGYLENAVRLIYGDYANRKSHRPVASYVEAQLAWFSNPAMNKILELTRSFDPAWEERLKSATRDGLYDAVDSIVARRHEIAHGENSGISYATMKDYYKRALCGVDLLESTCV